MAVALLHSISHGERGAGGSPRLAGRGARVAAAPFVPDAAAGRRAKAPQEPPVPAGRGKTGLAGLGMEALSLAFRAARVRNFC